MIYYLLAVGTAVLTGMGQVSLKLFSAHRNLPFLRRIFHPQFVFSATCFGGSFLLSVYVLQYLDFTVFYTLTALNFGFVALFSSWVLGEAIDARKIWGIVVIMMGLAVFNAPADGWL